MSVHQCLAILICSYLTVMSSIYIPHLQLIISKSYAYHIRKLTTVYNHILLVTAISILTGSNTFTVLLEYINLFQSQSPWQYKANIREELPILGLLHYLIFKPH